MSRAEAQQVRRVLVVTDDPHVADEARFALAADIEMIRAHDARDAEEQLAGAVPDAVVVDLRTGKAGGYALAKDMSQMQAWRDVPVMILLERDQDRWLASEAGARIIRTKPLAPSALAADVLALLAH